MKQKQSHTPESTAPTVAPTHAEIAHCAREIWIRTGRPEGRDGAIWLEAESRLIGGRQMAAATAATAPLRPTAIAHPVPARPVDAVATRAPTSPDLAGAHQRTYDTIFQYPVSHNLRWRDVHALFRQLGQVEEKANGSFLVTRNGQTLILPASRTKDVGETEEVMKIRHFLERSTPTANAVPAPRARCLVIVNHHEVRIFHSALRGTAAEQVLPHDPDHFFRHAPNSRDFSRGQEKPDPNSFFAPVAKALLAANQILIFGSGTGTSSEMEQFVAWLHTHHPELARRIVGSLVVDEHHLTDGQLLAKARDFYATPAKLHRTAS